MPNISYNLLELLVEDGLSRAGKIAKSKKRQTANLHPLATWGLFNLTRGMSNEELLRLFNKDTKDRAFDKDDFTFSRRLRNPDNIRSAKFSNLNPQAVILLTQRFLSKSKIVRGWLFCLILEATRLTAAEVRKKNTNIDLDNLKLQPLCVVDPLVSTSIEWIHGQLNRLFELAEYDLKYGVANAEERRYLPYAASLILEEMARPQHPEVALKMLSDVVYPALDRYPFGLEEVEDQATNDAYLASQ